MALSGSFEKYPVSGFGLYCTWSATQSVTGNYSDVTLNVYLKYYTLSVGARSDSTISINGTSETYTAPAIDDYTSGAKTKLLKTKTVRVAHNTDGTKSGVALSASWRFSGTYSGVSIGTITASTSVTLDSIDRTAPTVSCSVGSITANGFKITATSSATADVWQYSLNGSSSYTQFSTASGTSATITLSSLSPNTTYSVRVRARKQSNQVYGTSGTVTAKTLGGAVINSCPTITADAATVTFRPSVTVYNASYTYYVTIYNGSTVYLALTGRTWSTGTSTRTITLTAAERTELLETMAEVKSFTATVQLVTMSGSTQIGNASTCTCTIQTTEANSGPTMTAFTFKDSRSTTATLTGNDQVFIQGYSYLYVTPGTATAKNGASIVKYSATCNGKTASNTTGASLNLYLVALRKKMVGINTPSPEAALHVVGDTRIEGTLIPDIIDYAFEKPYFGICDTAADTAAKVVTCDEFSLKKGTLLAVQFTNANTASSISMNVNGTGAIAVCGLNGYYVQANMWVANQMVHFVYNGTWWIALNCLTATTARYGLTMLSSSTSSTSTALAATPSAVKQAYDRNSWTSISLTNALAVAYGGTGATTAATARSNLGIACTSLYNGTLTSGSITFNYGNYNFYVIIARPSSSASRVSLVIPRIQLTTTATAYQIADESNYKSFNLSYSGSTVTLTMGNGNGQINRVFGVN